VREIVEIFLAHLTSSMGNGYSVLFTYSDSTVVGLFANVICSGASAINGEIDLALFGNVPEHSFAYRRATDVTQADDEDFGW